MEKIIIDLLINHKLDESQIFETYTNSTDEYERKLLSMTNRVSNFFSLTYKEDYTIGFDKGKLVVVFHKFYSETTRVSMYVYHAAHINELTVVLDDFNSVSLVNPYHVEKAIIDFYKR